MEDDNKDDVTADPAAGDANPGEADAEETSAEATTPVEEKKPEEPVAPASAPASAEASTDKEASTDEEAKEAPAEEAAPAADETLAEPASGDDAGYQFDDDVASTVAESAPSTAPAPAATGGQGGGGNGRFAEEIFSKTIHAKFRTFYVDLKESSNGKFVKVSEKSRGRKSTIMMDAEDVPAMIEALQEAQAKL